jgi:hypothetical protein
MNFPGSPVIRGSASRPPRVVLAGGVRAAPNVRRMPPSPAGDSAAAPADALLARHRPLLRFDRAERWFPVSAAAWTDAPGQTLRRADRTVLAGGTVARAGGPVLSLGFLGPARYAGGAPVLPGDAIVAASAAHVASAAALHDDPRYADRVYGRARSGADGRVWLQYRWFYLLNDYRLVGRRLPAGVHEGDWEMIQLRLDAGGAVPDLALYLHHRSAECRAWEAIERVGGRPVVYVARGSHGCYATPGTRWTGVWFDHADGGVERGPDTLEVVDDGPEDGWIRWPGTWGGTRVRRGPLGRIDGESPAGPGAPRHLRWRDPAVLLDRVPGHGR